MAILFWLQRPDWDFGTPQRHPFLVLHGAGAGCADRPFLTGQPAAAADIALTAEEVARLETLADATGIDTRGDWEHTME